MKMVSQDVYDELRRDRDRWRKEAKKWKAELCDAMRVMRARSQIEAQQEARRQCRASAINGRW